MNSSFTSYDTSSLQRRFSQKLISPKRDPFRPNIQVDLNEKKAVKDTSSLPAGFLTTSRVRKSQSMKHYAIEGSMPKLGHILRELLETENDYVIFLERTVLYLNALLKERVVKIRQLAGRIFGNVEDILFFHKHVFLVRLEDAQNSAGEVSALMLEYHKDFTELYVKYCLLTCNSSHHLKDKAVKNFFETIRQNMNDKHNISEYIIKPIQRITKYELMLNQIINTYRKANIPCRNIERAYSVIKEVPTLADNAMKLNSILNYSGVFKINHLRQLKLHDIFIVSDRDKRFSHKKYYVFLMLDRIIFTKLCGESAETEKLCTFKRELIFEEDKISIKMETVPDKDTKIFVLQTYKKEIYMQAEKKEIKDKWLTQLKELIVYHYSEITHSPAFLHEIKPEQYIAKEPSYQPVESLPHTASTPDIDDSSSGGDIDSDMNEEKQYVVIDDFNPDETMNGFIALRKGQIYEVQLRELAWWHVILVGHVYTRNDSLTGLQGLAYPQFFTDYGSETFTSSESAISPESNLSDEQTDSLLDLSSDFGQKMMSAGEGSDLQLNSEQVYSPVMVTRVANKKYPSSSLLRHLHACRTDRSTTETEEDSVSGFNSARSSISRDDSSDLNEREIFYSVTSDSESEHNSKLDSSYIEVSGDLSSVFLNSDKFNPAPQPEHNNTNSSTTTPVTPIIPALDSRRDFNFSDPIISLNDQILLKYGSREELNADFPPDGDEGKPSDGDQKIFENLRTQIKAGSIPVNLNILEQDPELPEIQKLVDLNNDSRQSTPVALDNVINRGHRPLKRSTSDQSRELINIQSREKKIVHSEMEKIADTTEKYIAADDNDDDNDDGDDDGDDDYEPSFIIGDEEEVTNTPRKRSIHKIIARFNSCSHEIGKTVSISKRMLSAKRKSIGTMEELESSSPVAMRLKFFADEQVSNEDKFKTLTPPKGQRKHDVLKRTLSIDAERSLSIDAERSLQIDTERSLQIDTDRSLQIDTDRSLQIDTERSLQIDATGAEINTERPSSTDTINSSINSDFIIRTHSEEPTYLSPPTLVGDEKVILTTGANKTRILSPELNVTYKMPIKITTKKVSSIPLPPPKKPKPKIKVKGLASDSLMGNFEITDFGQLFEESPLEITPRKPKPMGSRAPPPIHPKNKVLINEYRFPVITKPLQNLKVVNGRLADISFELDQEVENVQVDWYKDACLATSRRYYASVNGRTCSLRIWDFGELDQGLFEAVVKTRAGHASTKCDVQLANK